MKRLLFLITAVIAITAGTSGLFSSFAVAQERQIMMEFMGFTEDGEHFIVKRYDHNIGWGFSVRSLADGAQVREHLFTEDQEDVELRRLRRRYKALDEGTGPASPDDRYVVLGAQDGRFFDILVMEKPRIGLYQSIEMPMDGKKVIGEGMLKKAVWNAKGSHLVIILNQKTSGVGAWERDTLHVYRFRPWHVKWFYDDDDPKKGEKK